MIGHIAPPLKRRLCHHEKRFAAQLKMPLLAENNITSHYFKGKSHHFQPSEHRLHQQHESHKWKDDIQLISKTFSDIFSDFLYLEIRHGQ